MVQVVLVWDEEADMEDWESHERPGLDALTVGIWDPEDGECEAEAVYRLCKGMRVSPPCGQAASLHLEHGPPDTLCNIRRPASGEQTSCRADTIRRGMPYLLRSKGMGQDIASTGKLMLSSPCSLTRELSL